MQSHTPASRAAEAAQLSQAVERFLAAGGKAEVVPIGRCKDYHPYRTAPPHPDDVEPSRARKDQANRGYSIREAVAASRQKHQAERDALAPQIKQLAESGMTTMDIARHLRVSHVTVRRIADTRAHKIKLNPRCGRQPSMTDDQVRSCRVDYVEGLTYMEMAKKYGVSKSCIRDLVTGKTRSDVI